MAMSQMASFVFASFTIMAFPCIDLKRVTLSDDAMEKIGFPSPLLGAAPMRLSVLAQSEGCLVLEKPSGVAVDAHPLYPKAPSLVAGINAQLEAGKPELQRLGLEKVYETHPLDAELPGLALLAVGQQGKALWRNVFGSRQITFGFRLLTFAKTEATSQTCELPLARHFEEARMVVSHKTGKRTATTFRQLESIGRMTLWEATTDYLRLHQVRLHALESALPVAGDPLYVDEKLANQSGVSAGQPLCWLASLSGPFGKVTLDAPPEAIAAHLRRFKGTAL